MEERPSSSEEKWHGISVCNLGNETALISELGLEMKDTAEPYYDEGEEDNGFWWTMERVYYICSDTLERLYYIYSDTSMITYSSFCDFYSL